MVLLNACICIIIFLIGYNLKNIFFDFKESDRKILNGIFFYHFGIAVLFHFIILEIGGDAIFYWNEAKVQSFSEIWQLASSGSASGVMYLINYIPSKLLNLSFFTGNMVYALIGYMGFIYLYRICIIQLKDTFVLSKISIFGVSIFPWIFFLPNLHFWSSGIGKDSLLFFSVSLFVYSMMNISRRWYGLLISLIISIVLRPHITLFLLLAFGIGYLIDGRLRAYQKIFIFMIFMVGFVSIFDYVLEFVKLESFETEFIVEYTSTKASTLNQASSGSGIDISGYPLILKVFTFLYRPLFFDINGVLAVIASIENSILLIFSFILFGKRPIRGFRNGNSLLKGIFIYFIIGTIAFSLILGNLGIMLRQKNMFIPLFLIFGLWIMCDHRRIERSKQ